MLRRTTSFTPMSDRRESERAADAGYRELAVAAGKHAFQVGAVDLDAGKARPAGDVLHGCRKGLDLGHGRHRPCVRYPATAGDADEIHRRRGVAGLPAGLSIDLLSEHDDAEIAGLLQADGRQPA